MAPSQISCMKMRNLLFGVILGLLAIVHSTPVDTFPAKTEDDVLREALTDGFLVNHISSRSLTTTSPKRNATVHESQQSSSEPKESESEGSGAWAMVIGESTTSVYPQHGGENSATTAVSVSQSSASTVLPGDTDTSSSHSSTTQSPQSSSTSSAVPNEGRPNVTPDHISVSQTTDPAVSTSPSSDLWSGHDEISDQYLATTSSTTSSFNTQTNTASSSTPMAIFISESDESESDSGSGSGSVSGSGMGETLENTTKLTRSFHVISGSSMTSSPNTASSASTAVLIKVPEGSGMGETPENTTKLTRSFHVKNDLETASDTRYLTETIKQNSKSSALNNELANAEPQSNGHSTPGWIIIVGFVVGVAALVMLCLAIATRDKWNGPSKPSQLETKTNYSNQQRELEMETFLHKESPRENGNAAEYTVIPLEFLERHSSH